jgi:hypothetical protein
LLGQAHAEEGHRQQAEEDGVLEVLQLVVQGLGQVELQAFEADGAADLVEQLGQGAEGAQPAAEEPPAPHEDGDDDEDPEDEDQRIGQEELPLPLEQQAVEPGEHLGDGRLGHGVEAHEADADYPAGVLEGIHRPLVLAVGAAHQPVAAGVGGGDDQEQGGEGGNIHAPCPSRPSARWGRA